MADDLHPAVVECLDRLSDHDPVAALDAGVALSWLVGQHGLDRLHQAGLQQFLWYELPFKWLGPVAGRHELVVALGRFFDLAGLPRYAAVCRSTTTTELLELWAADPRAGFAAFHAAHLATGVVPPDGDLGWGDLMGEVELAAFWSTAQALELAVDAGALQPGAPGWKHEQLRLARRHLDQPRPERFGESLRQGVLTERLAGWAEQGKGDARSAIVAPVTNVLLHEVPVPPGASRSVRPLSWLVEALEDPARPAGHGGLPPRFVREATARFGWGPVGRRASEADLAPLVAVRELATGLRLIRRRDDRWTATPSGAARVVHPHELWRSVAVHLGDESGFAGAVSELLDALLVAGERPRHHEVVATLRVPLTEEGWHGGLTGRPVSTELVEGELEKQLALRVALGAVARRGGRAAEPLRPTVAGESLLRAALRSRAVRPRRRHRHR